MLLAKVGIVLLYNAIQIDKIIFSLKIYFFNNILKEDQV